MRYLDDSVLADVAANARPEVLRLMGDHLRGRGGGDLGALIEVADTYLRLYPEDGEVREARERLGSVAGQRPLPRTPAFREPR